MRDPAATKAEIEAAIEGACGGFRRLKRLGWFPKKKPFDNPLRYEALELIKRLPDEVMPPPLRDYICEVLSKTRGLRRTYARLAVTDTLRWPSTALRGAAFPRRGTRRRGDCSRSAAS